MAEETRDHHENEVDLSKIKMPDNKIQDGEDNPNFNAKRKMEDRSNRHLENLQNHTKSNMVDNQRTNMTSEDEKWLTACSIEISPKA